ncbi:MAG: hypothetical protein ACRETM_01595 [Stenotrophobium sp.]
MNYRSSITLCLALLVPAAGLAAAAPDTAQLLAQLPAWPDSVAAAASGQALAEKLQEQLKRAGEQLQTETAHEAYAGTALDMGGDPAQAQAKAAAMAKQMASMTDAQKMAFAMRMQAQMMSGTNMAAIPNAAETQAMQALSSLQEQGRANADLMRADAGKMTGMLESYQRQQQSLEDELTVKFQALNSKTRKANCVADWKQRQQLRMHYADQHVTLAGRMLAAMKPVYADEQKRAGESVQLAAKAQQTGAVIHNPALKRQTGPMVGGLRAGTLTAVGEPVRAYGAAAQEAQRWQQQHQQVYAGNIAPNCS